MAVLGRSPGEKETTDRNLGVIPKVAAVSHHFLQNPLNYLPMSARLLDIFQRLYTLRVLYFFFLPFFSKLVTFFFFLQTFDIFAAAGNCGLGT